METLSFESSGNTGVLTVTRPEAMNALNKQVIEELGQFFSDLPKDLRALILTGAGEKAFVAGADIKEMKDHDSEKAFEMSQRGQQVFQQIEDSPVPVIAALNGFALGGGLELALACDFIVAHEKAKLGLPEVGLGLIPGYGGTQRLSRVAGLNVARLMAMSGEVISAQQAYDWGVVTQMTGVDELMTVCQSWAEKLAKKAPLALKKCQQAINRGHSLALNEGLALEAQLFSETFDTRDKEEGISAFLEKRTPDFKGD